MFRMRIIFFFIFLFCLFVISCGGEKSKEKTNVTEKAGEIFTRPGIDPTVSNVYEEEKQKSYLLKVKENFLNEVERKKDSLRIVAKQIAVDSNFLNVYKRLKIRLGNLNEITPSNVEVFKIYGKILKEKFEKKIRSMEKNIQIPIFYQFYLPPARSFVKPNLPPEQDITLEDLSKVNLSVVEAIQFKKIVEGYEINKQGLIYKYIVPFYDENGEILGAIEVATPFLKLVENFLNENSKILLLILIKKDFEQILENIISQNKAKIFNNCILYYFKDNIDLNKLNSFSFNFKDEFIRIDNKLFLQVFLNDFKNNEIGIILLTIK